MAVAELLQRPQATIIAEAGVNHDGDVERGMALIDLAAEAGADVIKFQTFLPGEVTGRYTLMSDYMDGAVPDASRYELSARLALPHDDFRRLKEHADRRDIAFSSTPDGFASLRFLVDELGLDAVKIGSTEITHHAYLAAIAATGLPMILSTGTADLNEVGAAVAVIDQHRRAELIILQCTSEYPAPDDEMNLRAMVTLGQRFGYRVGLSDHSTGNEAAIAAIALGACVIEKHITLDRSLPGPDHRASLDGPGLQSFIASIRRTEAMLGDGYKRPTAAERRNIPSIRRGIVASRALPVGHRLTSDDLCCKRPFVDHDPQDLPRLVGRRLRHARDVDQPIRREDLDA